MQTAYPSPSEIVQRVRDLVRDLVTEQEAAEILKIAPGTLSVWRSTGRYSIPFIKVGRRVRYRRADLDAWLESRTRANGATE
jgi:excisionase family DNA binding protein